MPQKRLITAEEIAGAGRLSLPRTRPSASPARRSDRLRRGAVVTKHPIKIARIKVTVVNVPFIAPIRWSGGANADWTRLIIEMETDDGLVGPRRDAGRHGDQGADRHRDRAHVPWREPLRHRANACPRRPSCRSTMASAAIAPSPGSNSPASTSWARRPDCRVCRLHRRPAARGDSLRRLYLSPQCQCARARGGRYARGRRRRAPRSSSRRTASPPSSTRAG